MTAKFVLQQLSHFSGLSGGKSRFRSHMPKKRDMLCGNGVVLGQLPLRQRKTFPTWNRT
ncbi:Uncharacterized protein APZ42_012581 [Daphnia magna]|uniref:Uncharacterized protein n=1 Tax=Daphnia magna TaxID=35525 RepID=A0A162RMW0_9CRUS|nr:Uncharacterized protein APZ42_012581 [Daphnia magna]